MYDPSIRFHARHRPHAVAVSSLQGDVTYRQFDADIDRVAGALVDADLVGAKMVAVGVVDIYANWLILLALARLGIGSASVGGPAIDQALAVLAPDILISDAPAPAQLERGAKVFNASPDWIAEALRREPKVLAPVRVSPDALARITLSSGTTGRPKKIAHTWRMLAANVASRSVTSFSTQSGAAFPMLRFLCTVGVDTNAYSGMLSAWALGGAVILASVGASASVEALHRLAPTTFTATPMQLQSFVDRLPPDFQPMPDLVMQVGGSHLPVALGRALRLRLTTNVWNLYGSTEAGTVARGQIARMGDDGAVAGWIEPGVELQVVDDEDTPLPSSASGIIRMRTPALVPGYLDDEEATARQFKDGWFYPGDVGSLSADGLLRVEGRTDEVMNFGGVKFLSRTLEEAVLACAGVKDVAAFDMPNASGVSSPWLAIVRGEGLVQDDIAQALKLPFLPPVHIAWIDEIPRNDRGKVQRNRLRAGAEALNR